MSSLSSRKRYSLAKTKQLFKIALERRPSSIQSLRQSIAITNIKCERFVNTINNSTDIFHTSCNKNQEQEVNQEKLPFKKFIKAAKKSKEASFFTRARYQQHKHMEGQLVLPKKQQQSHQYNRQNRFIANPTSKSMLSINREGLHVITPVTKISPSPSIKPEHSTKSIGNTQNISKFWKKNGKGNLINFPHYRSKTEQHQRKGQDTIGDMTKFSDRKQTRSKNFLILQLQLNLNDTKRGRQSAGLPP